MYVIARIDRMPKGGWRAHAPDLPDCVAIAASPGLALARLKLRIEGELARALGRGEPLPGSAPASDRGAAAYAIHINLDHLRALVGHQQGRWDT